MYVSVCIFIEKRGMYVTQRDVFFFDEVNDSCFLWGNFKHCKTCLEYVWSFLWMAGADLEKYVRGAKIFLVGNLNIF